MSEAGQKPRTYAERKKSLDKNALFPIPFFATNPLAWLGWASGWIIDAAFDVRVGRHNAMRPVTAGGPGGTPGAFASFRGKRRAPAA